VAGGHEVEKRAVAERDGAHHVVGLWQLAAQVRLRAKAVAELGCRQQSRQRLEVLRPGAEQFILPGNGLPYALGQPPGIENRLAEPRLPVAYDRLEVRIGAQHRVDLLGVTDDIERANAVQKAGEHRFVRLAAERAARHHVADRRYLVAGAPDAAELRSYRLQ